MVFYLVNYLFNDKYLVLFYFCCILHLKQTTVCCWMSLCSPGYVRSQTIATMERRGILTPFPIFIFSQFPDSIYHHPYSSFLSKSRLSLSNLFANHDRGQGSFRFLVYIFFFLPCLFGLYVHNFVSSLCSCFNGFFLIVEGGEK